MDNNNGIINDVNSKLRKKSHKYVIDFPRLVQHDYSMDKFNNDTIWKVSIKKMRNMMVQFDILEEEDESPKILKHIGSYLVFEVKIYLTHEARLVAGWHKTPYPERRTYADVLYRETVIIYLTYSTLMVLYVMMEDINNTYLTSPTMDHFYFIFGLYFISNNIGKKSIIKRPLYRIKSSRQDLINNLCDFMNHLGYSSCRVEPDLCMILVKNYKKSQVL